MDEDRPTRLRALRDQLTDALLVCETREIAAIAKQLRETLAELESLPVAEDKDPLERIKLGFAVEAAEVARRANSTRAGAAPGQFGNQGPGGN